MKTSSTAVLILVFALLSTNASAQKLTMDNVTGTWKGTSLCQVKNSPCHDEIVVYHISKGSTMDSVNIQANKIVNEVEEDMGILPCRIDAAKNQLESTTHNIKWVFSLKKDKLDGVLYARNQLYRIIKLSKM